MRIEPQGLGVDRDRAARSAKSSGRSPRCRRMVMVELARPAGRGRDGSPSVRRGALSRGGRRSRRTRKSA